MSIVPFYWGGSVTKQNSSDKLEIHWVNYDTENSEDGQIDENKDINATTDIIHNKTDNKDYRVAILRLKDAGTYQVNTGSLSLDTQKSQGVSIAPFEELELTLNNQQVSGEIKYAEENTKYVLRTYFAKEKGGADYLIDEQEITNSSSISVNIPSMGALAPSGEYYVTSFLMTEKSVESIDENGEKETLTGLVAIDHQQFNTQVSYQNQNQPTAPQTVTLELAGNEVMTATWGAVTDADGYAVTIYQKDGNDWIDTGFGYDLDKETTSINMALTVGGEETTKSKNLSENETYKVGVSAYKTIEGGKYYSAETESAENGVYLPEYTPLDMFCGHCGTGYRRCVWNKGGVKRAVWRCGSRLDYGAKYCKHSETLEEKPLQQAILNAINSVMDSRDALEVQLMGAMEQELAPIPGETMSLADIDRMLEELEKQFNSLLAEASAAGGTEDYAERFRMISNAMADLKEHKSRIKQVYQENELVSQRLKAASIAMSAYAAELTEWDQSVVYQLVEKVTVLAKDKIRVTFRNGTEVEQEIEQLDWRNAS